jgi:putative zinc finger/helix-turn-helix YgiT family protein
MSCSAEKYHYKECGLDTVYLENVQIHQSHRCNEQVVRIPEMPRLNLVIGDCLLQMNSILNGKEIRFLRKNMGLKAVDLQNIMGVNNARISRWERGKQKISTSHDRLLRVVYANIKGVSREEITSMIKDKFARIKINESASPPYHID